MVKKINFRKGIISKENTTGKKTVTKRTQTNYANNLEYELIASLVMQQYATGGDIKFDQLLSIPVYDRIPGFIDEYGSKRMHQLLTMIIRAFVSTYPLPKTKKLSETKISVLACEIMIGAKEDQLSLEDIIVFFEQVKIEKYGTIKLLLHHQVLLDNLEQYRQQRHEVYMDMKKQKEAEEKNTGPVERITKEPTIIGDLFHQAPVIEMHKRKSG